MPPAASPARSIYWPGSCSSAPPSRWCCAGHRLFAVSAFSPMKNPIHLYGIVNCDTMKKARAWLDSRHLAYVFHDYKKDGIARDKLDAWCKVVGWEVLLNRAGTTFRKLSSTSHPTTL